jgi:hypothetical protein
MTRERTTATTRTATPNPIQRADMRRKLPKRMALAGAVTAACLGMGLATAQGNAQSDAQGNVQGTAQDSAVRGRMLDRAAADPRAVEIDGARPLPRSSERELPKASFVPGDERAPAVPAAAASAAAPADPGVCRTFTAFGTDDAPLRLSVDGPAAGGRRHALRGQGAPVRAQAKARPAPTASAASTCSSSATSCACSTTTSRSRGA